jgi:hypothetical protein
MHQNLIASKHGRPTLDLSLNNPSLEKKKKKKKKKKNTFNRFHAFKSNYAFYLVTLHSVQSHIQPYALCALFGCYQKIYFLLKN